LHCQVEMFCVVQSLGQMEFSVHLSVNVGRLRRFLVHLVAASCDAWRAEMLVWELMMHAVLC